MIAEVKKDMKDLMINRKILRNFGLIFCIIFGMTSGVMYWKGHAAWKFPAGAGLGFLLSGYLFPMVLRRLYWLWMFAAAVMGWGMTRVVLFLAFSLIMTPMGCILRLLGKDILDKNIHKEARTYWKKHVGVQNKDRYMNQF